MVSESTGRIQVDADAEEPKSFLDDAREQLDLLDRGLIGTERSDGDQEIVDTVAIAAYEPDSPTLEDERASHNLRACVGDQERRRIDVGPEGRGKSSEELLVLAGEKLSQASRSVRIDVERLDTLMGLVSELVADRANLVQLTSSISEGTSDTAVLDSFVATARRLGRIADELQDQIHIALREIERSPE